MSTVKTIAKNSFFLSIAEIGTRFLQFILAILLARYLGVLEYGRYSFILALTALIVIVADMGLSNIAVRDVARDKELAGTYFGNFIIFKIILSTFMFIIMFVIVLIIDYPPDIVILLFLAGISVVITSFNQLFFSIYRAFEQMKYETFNRIFEKILLFISILIILFFYKNLYLVFLAMIIVSALALCVNAIVIRKIGVIANYSIRTDFMKVSFYEAIPFALIISFQIIYFRIDTIFLASMIGDAVVGWYNAAYNIVYGLMAIATVFEAAIFPSISRFFKTSQDAFYKINSIAFKYLLLIGLPLSVFVTITAEKIILFIYGLSYLPSVIALQILVWSFFIMCICGIPTLSLNGTGHQRIVAIGMGITAIANVFLNIFLIPLLGMAGAAIATIIVCFFEFFFEFYFMNKYVIRIRLLSKDNIKIGIISFIVGIVIYFLNQNLIISIFITITISFLLLIIFRVISKDDKIFIFSKISYIQKLH